MALQAFETMWRFPTVSESFVDADAGARDCITAVNSERWVHCGGSLQEYVPITAPTVSAIPSL